MLRQQQLDVHVAAAGSACLLHLHGAAAAAAAVLHLLLLQEESQQVFFLRLLLSRLLVSLRGELVLACCWCSCSCCNRCMTSLAMEVNTCGKTHRQLQAQVQAKHALMHCTGPQ
jgi:hypothetical protein